MTERTLDWTFQLPPLGDGASGLEDYVAESSEGRHYGKVATLLSHEDEVFVVVEHGSPPVTHDLVVVPWESVREIDHDELTVRLELDRSGLEQAPRLDHSRRVEQEDADAMRVTEVPGADVEGRSPKTAEATGAGPVEKTMPLALSLGTGLLGVFAVLALAIFASGTDFGWEFGLFAIPVVLWVISGITAYRLFRNPYARR